jgi:ABC-type polysaccharide/polyol phosphate transport system ATPase subunit
VSEDEEILILNDSLDENDPDFMEKVQAKLNDKQDKKE